MSQPETFVTSDHHFGHANIIEFEKDFRLMKIPGVGIHVPTPEQHWNDLIYRWNQVVRPKDTVWHLGDLCFGAQNLHWVRWLNGHIRLVLGNHDTLPLESYRNSNIEKVCGARAMDRYKPKVKCILTHIPVHPNQLEFRFHVNLHGHLHSKSYPDSRYINCSVERWQLAPVRIDEVLKEFRER